MSRIIICPICDEELGNSLDEIPEKCPICDTRKHEIKQEIEAREQDIAGIKNDPQLIIDGSKSTIISVDSESDLLTTDVIISPEIEADEVGIDQDDESQLNNIEIKTDIEVKSDSDIQIKEENIDFGENDNDSVQFEAGSELEAASEIDDEEADVEFESNAQIEREVDSPVEEEVDTQIEQETDSREQEIDSQIEKEVQVGTKTDSSADLEVKEETKPVEEKSRFTKSGASSLEQLPEGFRYCPNCESLYTKQSHKIYCDNCPQIELKIVNKGLIPGHYLILYSCEKKPIAFFRLEPDASIYIGRANERGSLRDIDISLAWKNHYQKNTPGESLKDKMKSLKGVSRNHILIRYMKSKEKYIAKSLSETKYTTFRIPNGEKILKNPKDKSPVELESGTNISMGDHQNFIKLLYKVLEKKD